MRICTGFLFALAAVGLPYAAFGYTGAQASNPSNTIPATITECESPAPNPFRLKNCGTLNWNGQQYDAQWNGVENAVSKGPTTTATVTISFDKDGGVRLDRVDTAGTPGVTATYNGKIAADNTISGSVTWFNNGVIFGKGKWSGTVTIPAPQAAELPAPGSPIPPTPTPTPPAPSPAPMPPISPPPPPADAPPATIELGQTVDQVVAGSGQPTKILKPSTSKQIYVYKDMRVTFTNGKVTGIE
jgi:hypothetical protein